MKIKVYILCVLFCVFGTLITTAQKDSLSVTKDGVKSDNFLEPTEYEEPLAPAKAAFYSAVLPGLGQAYNRSYWKIPVVYAGLGVSIYMYANNNSHLRDYRRAYKRRLAGYDDDEYQGQISDQGLIEGQKRYRKNKELSMFAAVIIYALNIVDANVEAHLRQFNVNENLSVKPDYEFDEITGTPNYRVSLNYKF